MIRTLLNSMSALTATMGLTCFIFTVYAIFGMTVWSGALHNRCYTTEHPVDGEWIDLYNTDLGYSDICSSNAPCPDFNGERTFCGNRFTEQNDDGTPYSFNDKNLWVDSMIEEQFWGFNNFDTLGSALLTVF